MDKNSKIFVAGHKGTAGSALVEELLKQGFHNLITQNHQELDLTNQAKVQEFFAKEKIECVFLCAVLPCGAANVAQRADFLYENLMIQNNVLHSSFLNGVKKLVCYGSGYMYPEFANNPLKEEYLQQGELEWGAASFGTAKIALALLCESYNLQYGTNFLCLALNNLYGKTANFDLSKARVLPALLRKFHLAKLLSEGKEKELLEDLKMHKKQAQQYLQTFGISEKSVEIWGSGLVRREFLHSEDLAKASIFVMENVDFKDLHKETNKIKNSHINVGTGIDYTIKEVALLVKEVVGFKGELVFNTNKPDSSMDRLMDISKIKALGWKAKINLKEGIMMMYEHYKKKGENNK
ncbi:GDP-L-fucose synthase [Campylobacter sp. MIT 21-1685]|uniref:GDP-L-fucose synthase family protein n=1 Tax=unclassified Campylobacter TaxID=2593542 RepID=UPI00224B1303|nr:MULTISPECIES: GDP-L-fucose synthase [unclassified Campylobacter]MCX2683311.1 GDP-L-fucose synthase [Campylobacter sp. MIT 21-1684]MCX2751633.1 GDP-L-fucose synthase [Campylobacter sp. MIT 21-1682]MCX2807833.1 GDP-L-fucose synthase [Campylobacter sp. MIT 21-1685]